jgi:hypothetical protein
MLGSGLFCNRTPAGVTHMNHSYATVFATLDKLLSITTSCSYTRHERSKTIIHIIVIISLIPSPQHQPLPSPVDVSGQGEQGGSGGERDEGAAGGVCSR